MKCATVAGPNRVLWKYGTRLREQAKHGDGGGGDEEQAERGAADTAAGGGVVEQQAERGAADTAVKSSSVELRTSLVNAQLTRMLKSKKWSYILMVRIIIDLLSYH